MKSFSTWMVALVMVSAGAGMSAVAQESAPKTKAKLAAGKPAADASLTPLGRVVKLTFRLKGGDGVPPIGIICATQSYAAEISLDSANGLVIFNINGQIRQMESPSDHLLITFDSAIDFSGQEFSANVYMAGSTVAKIGEETRLYDFADKVMVLTVEAVK